MKKGVIAFFVAAILILLVIWRSELHKHRMQEINRKKSKLLEQMDSINDPAGYEQRRLLRKIDTARYDIKDDK
jgi:hypothetical protein